MFDPAIYQTRRRRLREHLSSGLVLICSNFESPFTAADNCYRFRQDSSFLYFCGLEQPGLALLFDLDAGSEILFGTDPSLDEQVWSGPLPSLAERAASSGIGDVASLSQLATQLQQALGMGRPVRLLPSSRAENRLFQADLLGIQVAELPTFVSSELIKAVVALRSVKGAEEIAELDQAADLGYQLHCAAMKMALPGTCEWEIAGELEALAARAGRMLSFPAIVTTHGEILHNHQQTRPLQDGDLLLVDAGVESRRHYASDHTRTFPVGGRFSPVQQELYQLVLQCSDRAYELIRPGITFAEVHREVCLVLARGLTSLGLMRGDPQDAVAAGAHALFMPHGLGHMLGLDVHDMEDLGEDLVGYDEQVSRSGQFGTCSLRLGRKLQEGFVLTVEPGVYFIPALIERWRAEQLHADFIAYERLGSYLDFGGIRVEDDVLVTATGHRLLGHRRIPRTVEELTGRQ